MKFKNNSISKNVLKVLIELFPDASNENPVVTHEPNFSSTNANKYVKECIESGWVSSAGKYVNIFEEMISDFTGAKYAVALTNGTVALRLGLYLVGVKSQDEVLMPPISFVATANAASHLGAIPHFIDIEPKTLGMDPNILSNRLNEIAVIRDGEVFNKKTDKKIAAILPVHVFGIPANIIEIKKIADKWNLPIVEDAAEALGSLINKRHCGLFGKCGIISFNGNKLITTGGGGVLITDDSDIAKKARHLSTTAKVPHSWEFVHDEIGWNDRMPNLNAALGVAELEKINEKIEAKKLLLEKYIEVFKKFSLCEIINAPSNCNWNIWLVTLRLTEIDSQDVSIIKNKILKDCFEKGIRLRPLWKPLNQLKIYNHCQSSALNVSDDQSRRLISLPSSPHLIKNL